MKLLRLHKWRTVRVCAAKGKIGLVSNAQSEISLSTKSSEAAQFASETETEAYAMAFSVGNVQLQASSDGHLNEKSIHVIEFIIGVRLVMHGSSCAPNDQRSFLTANKAICKYNVGSELIASLLRRGSYSH